VKFESLKNTRVLIIGGLIIVTLFALAGYFSRDGDKKETKKPVVTTTTSLPKKDAQACEFLTKENLALGGIVPDVDAKTSDGHKRCTYEDIGHQINYITLYVDAVSQCDILLQATPDAKPLPGVADAAYYSDASDPTIIVAQGTRCFFIQGAKTLVTKESLSKIATGVVQLFIAVDSSTTTTTQSTVVLPESSVTLPGQNVATTTTTAPPTGD
jgi:hypothetical protein